MAKKTNTTWRTINGKVSYREGVRPPWYEFEIRYPDGRVKKVVGKQVDAFLSEQWKEKEEEGL